MSATSNLGSICEALVANGGNNEMFDRYLMDFLALISSEKIDVGKKYQAQLENKKNGK